MNQRLQIRSWLEPFSSETGVAVAFDIFRCSTTIHTLVARNAGPVFVAPSLKSVADHPRLKKMRVFSELSQPVTCLERFDNSPAVALDAPWEKETAALVATTTGTPSFFAARRFRRVYVGSLVNFSALVSHLAELAEPITLIPSAIPEHQHVEDEITAYAMATALEGFATLPEFVRQCGEQAQEKILLSPRPGALAAKISTGMNDARIALELDRYSHVLALDFEPGDNPLFARVVKV